MPAPIAEKIYAVARARQRVDEYMDAGNAVPLDVLHVYLDSLLFLQEALKVVVPSLRQVIATREKRGQAILGG